MSAPTSTDVLDYELGLSTSYTDNMSPAPAPRPTARQHIIQIAAQHGWAVNANVGTGPNTVIDLITRNGEIALVTFNAEGTAATDIKVSPAGGFLAPIKAPRAMGLLALREVLEAEVSA